MRDINSLQPNEVIKLQGRKETKALQKHVFFKLTSGHYLGKNECGFYTISDVEKVAIVLPASDFIKPKPKKATQEWVRQEIAKYLDVKESESAASELQVGKWYSSRDGDYLVCVSSLLGEDEGHFTAYGFWHGVWQFSDADSMDNFNKDAVWIEATYKEVEEALVNEAKKRGYKEGVIVNLISRTSVCEGEIRYIKNWVGNISAVGFGNDVIFRQDTGKWAEIIQPELTELPEKWCVQVTSDNVGLLSDWRGDYDLEDGKCKGFLHSNKIWHERVRKEYTLLSFDDFKRLVLDKEEVIDWGKAGQLVTSDIDILITTGDHDDDSFQGCIVSVFGNNGGNTIGTLFNHMLKKHYKPYKGEVCLK